MEQVFLLRQTEQLHQSSEDPYLLQLLQCSIKANELSLYRWNIQCLVCIANVQRIAEVRADGRILEFALMPSY